MRATGSARELLALDAADPVAQLHRHPLWEAVFQGRLAGQGLVELALIFYPSLAGTARYLFSSKVSTLGQADGQAVFRELYEALTVPDADADRGWRHLALALGATSEQLEDSLASPPPEVSDYVAVTRGFGHRSAHEGVGAAWGVERQLPVVWERLADALVRQYRVAEPAVRYLRYQGSVAGDVERRIMGLVDHYLDDPWKTYEARRAARECVWAWKAICQRVATNMVE
jgi:pyrroloquinoline quinone (PQQ) biosynthesis protein C